MKKLLFGLAMVILVFLDGKAFGSPVQNGNFETGDFSGWTVDIATGVSPVPPTDIPAGTAAVLSSWQLGSGSQTHVAEEGSYFASLGTLAHGEFSGNLTYDITLSQTLSLEQGDTVSGWSFFFNLDDLPQDSAWVKILDGTGSEIASPWSAISGFGSPSAPYAADLPWSSWNWQAIASGTYTLELGVSTAGDDDMPSWGFFDNITVTNVNSVPEPSVASLLVCSFIGLAYLRKRVK